MTKTVKNNDKSIEDAIALYTGITTSYIHEVNVSQRERQMSSELFGNGHRFFNGWGASQHFTIQLYFKFSPAGLNDCGAHALLQQRRCYHLQAPSNQRPPTTFDFPSMTHLLSGAHPPQLAIKMLTMPWTVQQPRSTASYEAKTQH